MKKWDKRKSAEAVSTPMDIFDGARVVDFLPYPNFEFPERSHKGNLITPYIKYYQHIAEDKSTDSARVEAYYVVSEATAMKLNLQVAEHVAKALWEDETKAKKAFEKEAFLYAPLVAEFQGMQDDVIYQVQLDRGESA